MEQELFDSLMGVLIRQVPNVEEALESTKFQCAPVMYLRTFDNVVKTLETLNKLTKGQVKTKQLWDAKKN